MASEDTERTLTQTLLSGSAQSDEEGSSGNAVESAGQREAVGVGACAKPGLPKRRHLSWILRDG